MQNQGKRIFALLLMLCMLVGMLPMAALATENEAAELSESSESQYLLYSEDFESYTDKVELSNGTNASGWTYSKKSANGYAYIENGKLYFAGSKYDVLYRTDGLDWSNYTVEADISYNTDNVGWAALAYNVHSDTKWQKASVSTAGSVGLNGYNKNWTNNDAKLNKTTLENMGLATAAAKGQMRFKISVKNTSATLWIARYTDGVLGNWSNGFTINNIYEDAQNGSIGFMTSNGSLGSIVIDNIKVYKPFTVTYVADGVTVGTFEVNNGESVPSVPEVPEKEGYTGVWDHDGTNITADTVINAVYTAVDTPVPSIKFVGQQLNLGDDLDMNYHVSVDPAIAQTAVMHITVGNKEPKAYPISEMTANEDGSYVFTVALAAAQMTDNITLSLVDGETEVVSKTYTVRGYAEEILTGSYDAKTKAMVKAMLNYGAAAQKYFEYNDTNPANTGYEITDAAKPSEELEISMDGSVSSVRFYGASLVYTSKVAVRFYFCGSTEGITFQVGETSYDAQSKNELHYVEIPDINPQDYDEVIEIVVSNGTDSMTVGYSPMHYITRMYNKTSSSAELKALVQAMYGYHQAAIVLKNVIYVDSTTGSVTYDENAGTITAAGTDNTQVFLKASYTETYARNWKISGTITKNENKNLFFSFGLKNAEGKEQWFCVYKDGLARQKGWNWADTYYAPDDVYVFTNRPADFFYNKTLTYGGDKLHYELVLHDDVLKMYFGNDQEPTTLAWSLPLTEQLWGGFAVDTEYQIGFNSVDPCQFINAIDFAETNNDADKFQISSNTSNITYDKTAGTITASGTGNTETFLKASVTETYARNWKVSGTITKNENKNLFFSFGLKDQNGKTQWFCVYKDGLARQNTWNWADTYYAPDEQYVFTNRPADFFYNKTLTYGGDKLHYELVLQDDVLKMYFGNDQEPTTLAWSLPLTEALWGGFAVDTAYQVGFYSVDPCQFVNAIDFVETNNDTDRFQIASTTGDITYDKTAGTITAAGTGNTQAFLKASATESYARNWTVSGRITKADITKNLFFSFGLKDENGKEQWFCIYGKKNADGVNEIGLARQKGWNWADTFYASDEVYVFTNSCADWFFYKTAYTGGDVLDFTLELQDDVLKAYFGNKYNEKTLAWQLPVTDAFWGGFAVDSQYQIGFNSVDPCQFVISDITVENDNTADAIYIAQKSDNITADTVNGTLASNYDPATTDATNTEVYFAADGAGAYAKTWQMSGTVTKLEAKDNFYLSFGVRNAAGRSQWFCINDAGLSRQRYYNWADTYTTADGEHVFFNQAACSFYWKESDCGSDKLYYKITLDGDILKVYFGSDYNAMHLAWNLPLTEDLWGDFVPGDAYQLGITTVDPCAFEITGIKVSASNVVQNPAKLHKVENLQIRDPYILVDDGTYYMYGTRSFGELDVFTSTDLGVWTELAPAFAGGDEFWGNAAGSSEVEGKLAAYWAPEVFKYEGAYYMFATFTKDEEAMNQQAVVILKADSPEGPFTVWSEDTRGYKGAVTPADHSCIDGTLYIENGVPYMIYVHQHQCKNEACSDGMGSMAYVQLSADLKSTVGEYIECFDASDLDWISTITGHAPTVTDGPEVYTAPDGQKYLLWSTHWDGDYCQIASKFTTLSESELFTAVVRKSTKIFPEGTDVELDGGHGMIFKDLNGNDVLVLHSPNSGKERATFFDVTASASGISVAQRTIATPNAPTAEEAKPKYYVSAAPTNAAAITEEGQYVSSSTASKTQVILKAAADKECASNWEYSGTITKGNTSNSLFFSFGVMDQNGKTQWFCVYKKGLARQNVWNWADTQYDIDDTYVFANSASEHFYYKTAGLGGQKLDFTIKLENDVLKAYFGNDQYEKTLAWQLPLTEELWGGFAAGSSYQLCMYSVDPCQFVISDMEVITSGY